MGKGTFQSFMGYKMDTNVRIEGSNELKHHRLVTLLCREYFMQHADGPRKYVLFLGEPLDDIAESSHTLAQIEGTNTNNIIPKLPRSHESS